MISRIQTLMCIVFAVTSQLTLNQVCNAQITTMIWEGSEVKVASGEAILAVTSDSGYAKLESIVDYFGGVVYHHLPNDNTYLLKFDTTHSVTDFCDSLNSNNNTNFCEPSFIFEPATNDTYWDYQWNFRNTGQFDGTPGADIMLEEAHSITRGSPLIKVAILDTGIPINPGTNILNHPDLDDSSRIMLDCVCNTFGNDSTINDDNRHGTAVAGIVFAEPDNEYGIVGVAPACTGVIEKSADEVAHTTLIGILEAIDAAVINYSVEVLNLSYSLVENQSLALTQKIEENGDTLGLIFCFPTYNDAAHMVVYPANLADDHENVFAVGGTNPRDEIWRFWDTSEPQEHCRGSNWGPEITCVAPAGGLGCIEEIPPHSCVSEVMVARWDFNLDPLCEEETGERIRYSSGTSYASPTVAGIAALLLSHDSTLTATEIKQLIMESSDDVNADSFPGWDEYLGSGRVNAFKALLRAPGVKTLISDLHVRKHIYDEVSPYYLESGLIVPAGITMTLDPGVRILMGPGAYIMVNGSLVANGTANNTIKLLSGNIGEKWNGIKVNSGGSIEMDYVDMWGFRDYGIHTDAPAAPVSINHVNLNCADLKVGGVGLMLLNSPSVTQTVTNAHVYSVAEDSQATGMYLYNCKVSFDSVTIEDCDHINSQIKKVTGNFHACTFQDRTKYYGVYFNTTPNTPNFRCCEFTNLAPNTQNSPQTTIYCAPGTTPSFGAEGNTGGWGVSNTIEDSSAYLMIMQGTVNYPIIDSYNPLQLETNGGKNNWKQTAANGKFFQRNSMHVSQFPCTEQYWNPSFNLALFSPALAAHWNYSPAQSTDWETCGGGEGGGQGDRFDDGSQARNGSGMLDDVNYDSLFAAATEFENVEDYAAAQQLYRHIAENTSLTSLRWNALSHIVACESFVLQGSGWAPELISGLIELEDNYDTGVLGQRLLASYYQNHEEYDQAIETTVNLLSSGLTYEDSIQVAMDLVGIQLSMNSDGGRLDGAGASMIPATLRARDDEHALAIERELMALLNPTSSEQTQTAVPTEFSLMQNYPNPFNPETTIEFSLPNVSMTTLKVFDVTGREVTTLISEPLTAGKHRLSFDASSLSSGVYFYALRAGNSSLTRKMVLLK